MVGKNSENLSPDGEIRFSNIINGETVVKFPVLKDFIKKERGATFAGLAQMWGYHPCTITNTLAGRGKYHSCTDILIRLERHFDITVVGDPYR